MKTLKSKSKVKIIAAALVALLITAAVAVGCAPAAGTDETYEWEYNKPFAPQTDSFMTVDGVLDEERWTGQNRMEHSSDGITLTATTVFTEKGMYIGMQALDSNIQWYVRSAFDTNSSFGIQIVKEGEPTYNVNDSWTQHPMRNFNFNIDAKTSRSYRETPYQAKAVVDGEINSGATKSITAELFVTWADMNYTSDELGEKGCPDSVRVYIEYRKVVAENSGDNTNIVPSFMQSWRYDTYFRFGSEGLKTVYSSDTLGNADNGLAASDCWEIDDGNGTAKTTQNRTQVLWFKKSFATDFVMEADVTVDAPGEGYYPSVGLISGTSQDTVNMFVVEGRGLTDAQPGSKSVALKTGTKTDGLQWFSGIGRAQVVATDYSTDTVKLTMVKRGGYFYYFYNGEYWDSEYVEALTGNVYAGFFANDGATYSNYSFKDYTGDRDGLDKYLSSSVYFVEVPGVTARGSVVSSRQAVKKGQPVTLTVLPNSGYVLTEIKNNDVSLYDDFAAQVQDSQYVFTPQADSKITAVFTEFPQEALVDVLLPVRSGDVRVLDALYLIEGNNGLLYYTGSVNSKGNVVVRLPKAGEYAVGGRTMTIDGEYSISLTADGYHDAESMFILDDDTTSVSIDGKPQSVAGDKAYTQVVTVASVRYGNVTVNGATVESSGILKYDESVECYYSSQGNVNAYYKDMVGSEFIVRADMAFSDMINAGTDPVAGVAVAAGGKTIVLKSCRWEVNRLCVAIGNSGSQTSYEIAVNGFAHDIGAANGNLSITVVRYGKTLYVFDCDETLKLYFDRDGMHTVNGATVASGAQLGNFNEYLREFFALGDENAVGMIKYGTTGRVTWDVQYSSNGVFDYISGGEFTFETETVDYSATVDGVTVGSGFAKGTVVTIEVSSLDEEKAAAELTLSYGGENTTVLGEYDIARGVTVFKFTYDKACSATVSKFENLVTVTGTLTDSLISDFSDTVVTLDGSDSMSGLVNADGTYSIKLLSGVYSMQFDCGGKRAYAVNVDAGSGGASLGTIQLLDATLEIGESGVINGNTYAGYYKGDNEFFTMASKADSLDGEYTLTSGYNSAYAVLMPGTKTDGEYEFSVRMTSAGNWGMGGIGVTDGQYALSFQLSNGEANGKRLIIELAQRWPGNDFVLYCDGADNDNVWSGSGGVDATLTLRRYADRIELYAGREKVSLIMTISAEGYEFANAGWTVNNSERVNAHKDKLSGFFKDGAEHVMLYASNYTEQSLTYDTSFRFIENHSLSGSLTFADDRDETANLTLTDAKGVKYVYKLNGGEFLISLPYGVYSYTLYADRYESKSGVFTFDAENTALPNFEIARYVEAAGLTVTEQEDSLSFTWTENAADVVRYRLVMSGDSDVVVADTEEGLAAVNGVFTVELAEGDANYAADGTYRLIVTAADGKLAPPDEEFTAVPFEYGLINDLSNAEMASRLEVSGAGVTSSFNGGLMIRADGEGTAALVSRRVKDMTGVDFVNILLSGSGAVQIAGKTVELSGKDCYVSLTPDEYNGGRFTVVFNEYVLIKEITTDALDMTTSNVWVNNGSAGYGAVNRNADGSYTIAEADAASRYRFATLAMPSGTAFSVSTRIKINSAESAKGTQAGFALSSPVDGTAWGGILWDTVYNEIQVLSYRPEWTHNIINNAASNWLMSSADYAEIDKTDFTMSLVRDNSKFYVLIDNKVLAFIDSELIPLFITADKQNISVKDVPLTVGFGVRNLVGAEASSPADSVTFSDYSVSMTASHDALKSVTGTVEGADGAAALYLDRITVNNKLADFSPDGAYAALVPDGYNLAAYDGANAAFLGAASANVINGTMADATYMVDGTYQQQKESAEGAGSYNVPASFGHSVMLPSTKTSGAFDFSVDITMDDTSGAEGMLGVSIVNPATGMFITFQSVSWENKGASVLVDVKHSSETAAEYVVNCFSPNKFFWHGTVEIGFKISRTADRIVVSAGSGATVQKICAITSAGITFEESWTVSNSDRKTNNDLEVAEFFAGGVELACGYSSYDRCGQTARYNAEFTRGSAVSVTGTVNVPAGKANGTVYFTSSSGCIYEGIVADGALSIEVPEGSYSVRYTDSAYAAYQASVNVSDALNTVELTAVSRTVLGYGGLVNGAEVTSGTLTEEEVIDSNDGSFTLADNTSNFYYMPYTVTGQNYEYTVNMKNVSNMAGLSVTNGKSILSFQIASWESGGARVVVECSGMWMGNDFVLEVDGSTNTSGDATFTVKRYSDKLELYIGDAETGIKALTITSDGSYVLEACAAPTDESRYTTCTANQKEQLAAFFAPGTQHMVGLARNNAGSQSVTYTAAFRTV